MGYQFIEMITDFKIGNLCLRLSLSLKLFNPALDNTFNKFTVNDRNKQLPVLQEDNPLPRMTLLVVDKRWIHPSVSFLVSTDSWDLWQDENLGFIFSFKQYKEPFLLARVDKNFTSTEIHWVNPKKDLSKISIKDILDLRLYLNWLANFGDLVLHASGFVYEGKGYCFLGESGRGKSTLVRSLARQEGLTVLGEDQVILRFLDGQFRIFGTPWHTDPNLCAALDAPLEKIFFLDREQPATIREMSSMEMASRMLQTAFVPWYRKDCLPLILERVGLLSENIRCLTLSYKLGQDGLQTLLDA